jgi:hypothetical protein
MKVLPPRRNDHPDQVETPPASSLELKADRLELPNADELADKELISPPSRSPSKLLI